MDAIKIQHNGQQMVVTGGNFYDMLKAVKGTFKGKRAWFDDKNKTWMMPADFDADRIVKKGFQVVESIEAAKATEAALKRAADAKRQAEREAQWAQERAQRQAEYAAQKKAQTQAVAERVQVTVGEYKIGDRLNGKAITGFGKSWTITEPGTWGRRGVRYDEGCDCCGRIGEVDNETGLCERCGADGKSVQVCYAYFS